MTTVKPNPPFDSGDMLVALCVWREARGECYEAKLGVVWTLRNRCAMSPAQGFEPTMDGNVLKPWAFSSFNSNDPNSSRYPTNLSDPIWLDCLKAVNDPEPNGLVIPPAAFYRAVFYWSPPLTAAPKGWGPTEETARIGNLHFCAIAPGAVT